MLEGGSREPLIVNWPGVTPAGKVNHDLTDFTDFFRTFVELAGAKMPEGVTVDGRSFAPQIRGEVGTPREWVFVEFNGDRYIRDARYKLTDDGKLFDMKDAPWNEIAVPAGDANSAAVRKHLQQAMDELTGKVPAKKGLRRKGNDDP